MKAKILLPSAESRWFTGSLKAEGRICIGNLYLLAQRLASPLRKGEDKVSRSISFPLYFIIWWSYRLFLDKTCYICAEFSRNMNQ